MKVTVEPERTYVPSAVDTVVCVHPGTDSPGPQIFNVDAFDWMFTHEVVVTVVTVPLVDGPTTTFAGAVPALSFDSGVKETVLPKFADAASFTPVGAGGGSTRTVMVADALCPVESAT